MRVKISMSGTNSLLILPPSCGTESLQHINRSSGKCNSRPIAHEDAHINIPDLQRKPRIPATSPVHKTSTLAAKVVCHFVPAQNGLGPVLEAWLEDFESFFRVGDVVVVTEAVAGEVVLIGAVAPELGYRGQSQVLESEYRHKAYLEARLGIPGDATCAAEAFSFAVDHLRSRWRVQPSGREISE